MSTWRQISNFFSVGPSIDYNQWYVLPGRTKARRQTKHIPYYPNCVATFQLLMTSGDISPNPGPVSATAKPAGNNRRNNSTSSIAICPQCEKSVRRNCKHFLCEVCISFTHAGTNLKQIRADTPVTGLAINVYYQLCPFTHALNWI